MKGNQIKTLEGTTGNCIRPTIRDDLTRTPPKPEYNRVMVSE